MPGSRYLPSIMMLRCLYARAHCSPDQTLMVISSSLGDWEMSCGSVLPQPVVVASTEVYVEL